MHHRDFKALIESNREILDAFPTEIDEDGSYDLLLMLLVKSKNKKLLSELFAGTSDKQQFQKRIDLATSAIHGEGFALTQHGISRTLGSRYSENKLTEIGEIMLQFEADIKKEIGVDVFITSGTLLGIVRSGKIIAHDDDFDLAYVSQYSTRADILRERRELAKFLTSHEKYIGKAREKHFTIRYSGEASSFFFDLFPSWIENGLFTEVPLRPAALSVDEILPLSRISFYGVDLPAPKNPEALLEINYGPNWRIPDPSFRFDFGEYASHYWFLHEDFLKDDFNER